MIKETYISLFLFLQIGEITTVGDRYKLAGIMADFPNIT
jgi:hypothetical protein